MFLPTFRRIEGGFTLSNTYGQRARKIKSSVEEALLSLSRLLTNNQHTFVTSISSVDIVDILLREYADLSQLYNDVQIETSQDIINSIKLYKRDVPGPLMSSDDRSAEEVLDRVQSMIESLEDSRVEIMTPIESFREVVERLFKHVGIKIDSRLSFGDAASAVSSDELSAGEKQMLSFLCYNAFHKDAVFFIDEPELSLHVDWQRQLFNILRRQNSTNQFIMATHSPFIYSKYPESELSLDGDRGDSGED